MNIKYDSSKIFKTAADGYGEKVLYQNRLITFSFFFILDFAPKVI